MARVKEQVLQEIVRRVVEAVQPEKIVLFGSAALGNMGPDSDIDLLVIKSGAHRRRTAQSIYANLFGIGQGVVIIVVTPEDIEMYHSALGLIIGPALEQGKVIYDSTAIASGRLSGVAEPGKK